MSYRGEKNVKKRTKKNYGNQKNCSRNRNGVKKMYATPLQIPELLLPQGFHNLKYSGNILNPGYELNNVGKVRYWDYGNTLFTAKDRDKIIGEYLDMAPKEVKNGMFTNDKHTKAISDAQYKLINEGKLKVDSFPGVREMLESYINQGEANIGITSGTEIMSGAFVSELSDLISAHATTEASGTGKNKPPSLYAKVMLKVYKNSGATPLSFADDGLDLCLNAKKAKDSLVAKYGEKFNFNIYHINPNSDVKEENGIITLPKVTDIPRYENGNFKEYLSIIKEYSSIVKQYKGKRVGNYIIQYYKEAEKEGLEGSARDLYVRKKVSEKMKNKKEKTKKKTQKKNGGKK